MRIENIKFKARRLNGGWVEGNLRTSKSSNAMIIHIEYSGTFSVNSSTVCQFTGSQDCDGTSIYEHDLLRYEKTDSIYEVVWNQGNTSFSLVNTEYPVLYPNTLGGMLRKSQLKVIGNKFDKKGGEK